MNPLGRYIIIVVTLYYQRRGYPMFIRVLVPHSLLGGADGSARSSFLGPRSGMEMQPSFGS